MQVYRKNLFSRRALLQIGVYLCALRNSLAFGDSGSGTYKTTVRCTPRNAGKTFTSVDGFWLECQDKVAYELNALFRQNKWLVNDASALTDDAKSALLTKEYSSRATHDLYQKLWKKQAAGEPHEARAVEYFGSEKHLF